MGVDIQTYRGRIGTFKFAFGQDVVTIECTVNFSRALKNIGCCIFIGLLLLMAGIESNPCPINIDFPDGLPETKSVILSGLPEDYDIGNIQDVVSKSYGTVTDITVYADISGSYVLKFDDIKDVDAILKDEVIKIGKHSVDVAPFFANVIRIRGLDLNETIEDSGALRAYFEQEAGGIRVDKLIVYREDNCVYVIFETEAGAKAVLQKSSLTFLQCTLEAKYLHERDIHSAVHSSSDPALESESKDYKTDEEKRTIFKALLQKCRLEERYPNKITIRDVVALTLGEVEEQSVSYHDLPWILLRGLIHVDEEARDKTIDFDRFSETQDDMSEINEDYNNAESVSPLDVFIVVFQCCDFMLQQLLFQKLYLCKLAVPFIYMRHHDASPVVAVWPLRSLKVHNLIKVKEEKFENTEAEILDISTSVVTFARLGRPGFSKSKLINGLLSDNENNVFFNHTCNKGNLKRSLSDGSVDIFWLPKISDKGNFDRALTFLNCRGDFRPCYPDSVKKFVTDISDCIILILDIKKLTFDVSAIRDVLKNISMQSVILIIAGPIIQEDKECLNKMYAVWKEQGIRIVFTHANREAKNIVEIVSDLSKKLKYQLKCFQTLSLQYRISKAYKIDTDEDEKDCKVGKQMAKRVFDLVNFDDKKSLDESVTPVCSLHSKTLGNYMKKLQRAKNYEEREKCQTDIKEVRLLQLKHVSTFIKDFCKSIVNSNLSQLQISFFFCWLKQLFEDKLQKVLNKEYLVYNNSAETFKLEHIFKEIGYIYDSIIALQKSHKDYGLPPPKEIAKVVSKLLIGGYPLEIIDGENFFLPAEWIHCVLDSVSETTGKSKFLSMSVLGVQSSGKSTLLNTMFGSQFSASAGRCTRGVHMQFIPICSNIKSSNFQFDFVLILDTEGLRAPELYNGKYEHDNELATVITGIGDVTIINIMGENSGEIHDILQVIVRAFLRLKMANDIFDIRKCCYFVHQNITDATAKAKKRTRIKKVNTIIRYCYKRSCRISRHIGFNYIQPGD